MSHRPLWVSPPAATVAPDMTPCVSGGAGRSSDRPALPYTAPRSHHPHPPPKSSSVGRMLRAGSMALHGGRSAVSLSFGFLFTACRIRVAACCILPRRCVRRMLWSCGFLLVAALPSSDSAGLFSPLFATFTGTMPASDCLLCVIGLEYLLSFVSPARLPGLSISPPRSRFRAYARA